MEVKISVLKYSHTWLKILIICDVLEFGCLLCTLPLLKQTEQLLHRIGMALLHLSPWEGASSQCCISETWFFVKVPEKGRDNGVFIKCDKCFHKQHEMKALLSLHLEFLCEGTLVTEETFVGGLYGLLTAHLCMWQIIYFIVFRIGFYSAKINFTCLSTKSLLFYFQLLQMCRNWCIS